MSRKSRKIFLDYLLEWMRQHDGESLTEFIIKAKQRGMKAYVVLEAPAPQFLSEFDEEILGIAEIKGGGSSLRVDGKLTSELIRYYK